METRRRRRVASLTLEGDTAAAASGAALPQLTYPNASRTPHGAARVGNSVMARRGEGGMSAPHWVPVGLVHLMLNHTTQYMHLADANMQTFIMYRSYIIERNWFGTSLRLQELVSNHVLVAIWFSARRSE
eukprot:GHVU01222755.1.p1 GENE.GHVU01222755.1~~GHVU01222755.1.p1  ORF type:complete len:130 (-),score=6.58 GHVU01222755.1:216-605(-)